jgi:hypothetical protein
MFSGTFCRIEWRRKTEEILLYEFPSYHHHAIKIIYFFMCSMHKVEQECDICFHICIPVFTVTDFHT